MQVLVREKDVHGRHVVGPLAGNLMLMCQFSIVVGPSCKPATKH